MALHPVLWPHPVGPTSQALAPSAEQLELATKHMELSTEVQLCVYVCVCHSQVLVLETRQGSNMFSKMCLGVLGIAIAPQGAGEGCDMTPDSAHVAAVSQA